MQSAQQKNLILQQESDLKKEELMYKHFEKIQRGNETRRQVLGDAEAKAEQQANRIALV